MILQTLYQTVAKYLIRYMACLNCLKVFWGGISKERTFYVTNVLFIDTAKTLALCNRKLYFNHIGTTEQANLLEMIMEIRILKF